MNDPKSESVNPYSPHVGLEASDEEKPIEIFVFEWRRRRRRWNRVCYFVSAALMSVAIATAYVSQTFFTDANDARAGIALLIGMSTMIFGMLVFVFGPISWFWTGQPRRKTDAAD